MHSVGELPMINIFYCLSGGTARMVAVFLSRQSSSSCQKLGSWGTGHIFNVVKVRWENINPSLWPSGISSRLGRNRLWVRFLEVSDIYPMFIEPTITWVPSGFSGYIWLDTKIVLKKKWHEARITPENIPKRTPKMFLFELQYYVSIEIKISFEHNFKIYASVLVAWVEIVDFIQQNEKVDETSEVFGGFLTVYDEVILPSMSLMPGNCCLSEEIWGFVKLLRYEHRLISFIFFRSINEHVNCSDKCFLVPNSELFWTAYA